MSHNTFNFYNSQIGNISGTTNTTTKIDDTKQVNGNVVKNLFIGSKIADICIVTNNTSNITARLYGECSFDGSAPSLSVTKAGDKVNIDVKWSGSYISKNLSLDISIPNSLYNSINAKNQSENITVKNSVQTKQLNVNTISGDLSVETKTCKSLNVSSTSGDINAIVTANTDVLVNLETVSGEINLNLLNVVKLDLQSKSMFGNTQNCFNNSSIGYTAQISASTISGNICVS